MFLSLDFVIFNFILLVVFHSFFRGSTCFCGFFLVFLCPIIFASFSSVETVESPSTLAAGGG